MFMLNGLILALTSLLLSGAGVWLNLYLTEHLSMEGMGLYQLILSVYTFGATLSCAGIQLAATRLVAEELAKGNTPALRRTMTGSMKFGLIFGMGSCGLLFGLAPVLGERVIGDLNAVFPLRVMALTLPALSLCAVICGYFIAVRRVYKTALCSIAEQAIRIPLVVSGVTLLVRPSDVASGVAVIALAGLLGEVLSIGLEYILYRMDCSRYERGNPPVKLTSRLARIALPVAFSSYLRSGLTTTKNLLVPSRLMMAGLSRSTALSMFGAVHGVALPVILFPAAILGSFSGLIIPEMAESHALGKNLHEHIHKLLHLNLSVSMGVGAALFVFAPELGAAVSSNPDVAVYIRLLAPVAPIMYLDTAVDCLLKGMDEQLAVMRFNVYDAFVSLVMVWFLLPVMGIKGYIIMVVLSEVFNLALSYRHLVICTGYAPDITEFAVKPLLCGSIAVLCVRAIFLTNLLPSVSPVVTAAAAMVFSAMLYVPLLRLSRSDTPVQTVSAA